MEVSESTLSPEYEIKVGDLFKVSSNHQFYILVDLPNTFSLINTNGKAIYNSTVTLGGMRDEIKESIRKGNIIHFPQSVFTLKVEARITERKES